MKIKTNIMWAIAIVAIILLVFSAQKKEADLEPGQILHENFSTSEGFIVTGNAVPQHVEHSDMFVSDYYAFSSSTDKISFGSDEKYNLSGDMTLALRFNVKNWSSGEVLVSNGIFEISHRGDWAGDRLYFLIRTDTITPNDGDSSWSYKVGPHSSTEFLGEISGPVWYDIVVRKHGNEMSFWINGDKTREVVLDFGNDTGNVQTEIFTELILGNFNGNVAYLDVYEIALSDSEIYSLFNKYSTKSCDKFSQGAYCYDGVPSQLGTCIGEADICTLYRSCISDIQCDTKTECMVGTCNGGECLVTEAVDGKSCLGGTCKSGECMLTQVSTPAPTSSNNLLWVIVGIVIVGAVLLR